MLLLIFTISITSAETTYVDMGTPLVDGGVTVTAVNDATAPNQAVPTYNANFNNSASNAWSGYRQLVHCLGVQKGNTITLAGDYKIDNPLPADKKSSYFVICDRNWNIISNNLAYTIIDDGQWHHFSVNLVITGNESYPIIRAFQTYYGGTGGYTGNIRTNNMTCQLNRSTGISANSIVIVTTGSTFSPILNVTGAPTVEWVFNNTNVSNSLAPNVSYGSASERTTTLTVTPWTALYGINLGYTAEDGGGNEIALSPDQNIGRVSNLELANGSLEYFSSYRGEMSYMNFSEFSKLRIIEMYRADGLKNISLSNTTNLTRLDVERCNLTHIDLSTSPNLTDLRSASQYSNTITINWGNSGSKLNHYCTTHMSGYVTTPPLGQFPVLSELYIDDANQTGVLNAIGKPISYIFAHNNTYTSVNVSGSYTGNGGSLYVDNNTITHIDISNCHYLNRLNASNNHMNSSEIDSILSTLAANNINGDYVDLRNNSGPSYAGILSAYDLIDDGWNVYLDAPIGVIPVGINTSITNTSTNLSAFTAVYPTQIVPMHVIPSASNVNITIESLNATTLKWKEDSINHDISTRHVIGGFGANTNVVIYRDSVYYDVATSNSTGYIDWTYTGGYSEHVFEAIIASNNQIIVSNPGELNINSSAIVLVESPETITNDLYDNVINSIMSGYTLFAILAIVLGGALVLKALGYI